MKLVFVPKDNNGQPLPKQERTCNEKLSGFGEAVYFNSSAEVSSIDIVLYINGEPVKRAICPRDGECHDE
jgi:hypothetical protein